MRWPNSPDASPRPDYLPPPSRGRGMERTAEVDGRNNVSVTDPRAIEGGSASF